jgi:hypothetical protein
MTDLETRLAAALHADDPPARDGAFRVEVLVRLERARFRRRVVRAVTVAAGIGVLAAVSLPVIAAWMTADGQRVWIVAPAATAALCLLPGLILRPRFRIAARSVVRVLYP